MSRLVEPDHKSDPKYVVSIELHDTHVGLALTDGRSRCVAELSPDEAVKIGNRLVAIGRAAGGKSEPVMRGAEGSS